MRDVSDDFLLNLAGISATMLGTFTVGVFFYLNSSLHHERGHGAAADRYMRSVTRWVFTAYSFPLLVPLVLVGAGPRWAAAAFALLGAALIAATVDTSRRILATGATRSSPSRRERGRDDRPGDPAVRPAVGRRGVVAPCVGVRPVAAPGARRRLHQHGDVRDVHCDRAEDEAADTAERRSAEAG